MSLSDLQTLTGEWVDFNFPDRQIVDAALVAAEEGAEYIAAITRATVKSRQRIRNDEDLDQEICNEFADTVIAFAAYCHDRGWSIEDIVNERLQVVLGRRWVA